MYANLRVTPELNAEVKPDAIGKSLLRRIKWEPGKPMPAWCVTVKDDGSIRVSLDGNDGDDSYADESGICTIKGVVVITADF